MTMRKRFASSRMLAPFGIAAAVSLSLISGATQAAAASSAASSVASAGTSYVYISNAESQDLSVFSLDKKDGSLVSIETVPVGGTAMPMALSPDRHKLYVALRSKPYRVQNFAINPLTGRLADLGASPLADSMAYLSVDKTGRYLFAASYGGNKLTVNPIGKNGVVGEPQQIIPTGPMAHSIATSPDNRYAFASVLGADKWLRLRFDAASGTLTEDATPGLTLPPKSGPRFFVFSPDNRFVYLIDELDGKLHVLAFDEHADKVRPVQTVSVLPHDFHGDKPWGSDLHVTPDGRFLFASERTSSTLAAYRIDRGTGHLTRIGTWPTETQPRGFTIDASGRYLIAVGEKSAHATVYGIGNDGALKTLGRYPTGRGPNWVEIVDFQ